MGRPSAQLRVAEDLRFLLDARHRRDELTVAVDGESTVGHIVESLGVPRTEIGAVRVDGLPVPLGTRPHGGEVIEVLPAARPQPILEPRFVLDVHLGALARRMRLLGLDTAYRNDAPDAVLLEQAAGERRTLLTQDRGLLRRRALRSGGYVRGSRPDGQLLDVVDRFDPPLAPWSRCLVCNGLLEPVTKRQVQHLLRDGTRRSYHDFSRCRACGRPYWRGAHAARLDAVVAMVLSHRDRAAEEGP
jgi:uncharacterized protein with PIN domain/sulfur carrier protein ThiS